MSSPRRSFFGSMKDKLRSRSPSPNPSSKNPFSPSTQDQLSSSTNLFPPASPSRESPAMGNTRAAELPADAPPPSYEASTNPTITVSGAGRPASIAPSFRSARDNPAISSPEDPYAFLGSFDTKVLIDDSGSMAGASWREVKLAIRSIAPICTSHDQDGIDVYFLNTINAQNSYDGGFTGIKHADDVERLFNRVRPSGGTPTGTRLNQILKPYLREYERQVQRTGNPESCGVKPVNMIVITDGVPTDDPESVIISLARKLDAIDAPPHQLGIQFFQVGKERGAAEALRELDDSLGAQANVRDIVDTVSWDKRQNGAKELSGDAILKTVLGAVVKRLDRRRVSLETPNLSVP